MGTLLPPVVDAARLNSELLLVPARHREDAIQEAWVAHLEGRDVIQAVKSFGVREHRHERREPSKPVTNEEIVENIVEYERSILVNETTAPRKSKSSPAHRAA